MTETDNTDTLKSEWSKTASLTEGGEANFNEIAPTLRHVRVGLGWDVPEQADGFPVDADASAFLLNRDGKVRQDTDFIFYNNLEAENGAIRHMGDNLTGEGDGDDEVIELDLEALPFNVEKVAFAVTLHNAKERRQTFGLVKNAFIRIVDKDSNEELARFDMTEDAADENGMIFGELAREGAGWKFVAIGQGTNDGLYRIAKDYGVNVAQN